MHVRASQDRAHLAAADRHAEMPENIRERGGIIEKLVEVDLKNALARCSNGLSQCRHLAGPG